MPWINETNLKGIARKQQSITRLFPTFHARVKKVADLGGVRLVSLGKNVWKFRVHSGTDSDKWYDVYFQMRDIPDLLSKYIPQKRNWTTDGKRVDLMKIARAIFYDSDVRVHCDCPAFQYWGFAYIASLPRYDVKYGRREKRRPKIRNPREYGIVCKHLQAILKVIPFYIGDIAKWLREKYGALIQRLERKEKENGRQKK